MEEQQSSNHASKGYQYDLCIVTASFRALLERRSDALRCYDVDEMYTSMNTPHTPQHQYRYSQVLRKPDLRAFCMLS